MDFLSSGAPFAALIFDCDGTLVETASLHYRAFNTATRRAGVDMPREWYFERVGVSKNDLLRQFQSHFGVVLDVDDVTEHSEREYHDNVHTLQEITAVAQIARAWHGKVDMAVASGGQRTIVETTLAATGLLPLFDVIVTVDDVGRGKPEPDLFLEAARRLGVAPADCIVFEDSREGLEAARRAGMRAYDVTALPRVPA